MPARRNNPHRKDGREAYERSLFKAMRVALCLLLGFMLAAVGHTVYSQIGAQKRLVVLYEDKDVTFNYESNHNHIVRININYFFEKHERDDILKYSGQNSVDRCHPNQCGDVSDETFFFVIRKAVNKEVQNRIYAMGVATVQGRQGFSATYFSRTIHELYLTKGVYEITLRPRQKSEKMARFRKELAIEWGPVMGPLED